MNKITSNSVFNAPEKRKEIGIAKRDILAVTEAELDAHPHEYILRMRQHSEVLCRTVKAADQEVTVYTVFSHELCSTLLAHPHIRQFYTPLLTRRGVSSGPLQSIFINGMQTVDGEMHRRRRKPLAGSFAGPVIKEMQPTIKTFVRDHLTNYLPRRSMNLSKDLAKKLPSSFMCGMIGIPVEDIDRIVGLGGRAFVGLTPFDPKQLPDIEAAAQELHEYTEWLVDEKRSRNRSEFLDQYLKSSAAIAPELTEAEIQVQLIGLILGSAETTGMAIVNAVSLLLSDRKQWEALKSDHSLIGPTVNETLRFEPSIGTCSRFTADEICLGEEIIPANSIISASLLGALRDPALYNNPQRFDIKRTDFQRKHLAFGSGAHRCLGDSLAWLEIFETISAIADFMPDIHLQGDPVKCTGFGGIRQISDCNVAF